MTGAENAFGAVVCRDVFPLRIADQHFQSAELQCLNKHMEQVLDALYLGKQIPKLKRKQLLLSNFTYHGIDMRTFLAYDLQNTLIDTKCMASTLYWHKGKWRIFLCVKRQCTNGNKNVSSFHEV